MLIAIGQDQAVWIKEQTDKGTAVWPAATDAVLITGEGKFSQEPYFNKDKQKVNTLGELGRLKGRYKPGEFSFPCYIRPTGSLGVAPVGGKLLKSLLGKEMIVTSTSVVYSQYVRGDAPNYLTILFKDNYETYLVQDVVVFKGSPLKIVADGSDDAFVGMGFSGGFLKMLQAGTDATAVLANAAATAITVVNARKYNVGQKIIVGTSGVTAGHLITAIDLATNIITIAATGLETEQASGVVVKGWTPSISVPTSYLMNGGFGKFQDKESGGAYADVLIIDAEVEINNGFSVVDNVKNDDGYPYDFKEGGREIPISLNRYVQSDGGAYRYEAHNQVQKILKLQAANDTWATSSGKRMQIDAANFQFDNPDRSGDAERKLALKGKAYETAALNDALTITFA